LFLILNLEEGENRAGMGIPCFACNPQMLPRLLEKALKGQDLTEFEKESKIN